MSNVARLLKSKTFWAAVVSALLAVLEINTQIITPLIPELYRPYVVMLWPVLMVAMRMVTKTALEDK